MNKYLQHLSKTMYNDKIDKVSSMLKEFLKYANQKNYPVNKEFFEYEIDILTQKDKDRIPFPLSKTATRIYKKYKDNLYDNGVVFPMISNQKYNKHLKELGKLAELKGEWIDYQYKLEKVEEVKTPKSDLTSHTDVEAMRPYIASTRKGKQKVVDALDNATKE